MKRNELTETFMMISNWKKPFGLHDLYKNKIHNKEALNFSLLYS